MTKAEAGWWPSSQFEHPDSVRRNAGAQGVRARIQHLPAPQLLGVDWPRPAGFVVAGRQDRVGLAQVEEGQVSLAAFPLRRPGHTFTRTAVTPDSVTTPPGLPVAAAGTLKVEHPRLVISERGQGSLSRRSPPNIRGDLLMPQSVIRVRWYGAWIVPPAGIGGHTAQSGPTAVTPGITSSVIFVVEFSWGTQGRVSFRQRKPEGCRDSSSFAGGHTRSAKASFGSRPLRLNSATRSGRLRCGV